MSQPSALPFRIKFCGLRRAIDVRHAMDAGADALGFNFCRKSRRFLEFSAAAELSLLAEEHARATEKNRVWRVGVFVNPSLHDLDQAIDSCQLDAVQLHGDEQPSDFATWQRLPIIKAVTWRQGADGQVNDEDWQLVAAWRASASDTRLLGFLVDAHDPILRGGTGRVVRWDLLSPRPSAFGDTPVILAGGLTASNVAEAIRLSQSDAVDTASGIESAPGLKDVEKMQQFVAQAKRAQILREGEAPAEPQL
jgi:phosphoribosylanthranilate isomerase